MRRSTKPIAAFAAVLPLFFAPIAAAQEGAPPGEEEMLGEEEPSRPPSSGKGVVWGVVTDAKTKEPVIDAQVSVIGTNKKAIADFDGRFRLELGPGNYELRVFYQLYKPQRVQNVRVSAGKVERVDVALSTEETKQEIVVEIEADPDRASEAAQTLIRKNAANVGDAVSAQEIARTPDRNAADAARRVVGASVVGSKYVYVRGLGERYTNALLNGTPLPSPEPDRQAVPFDLFPTSILSDLTIVKTFTPDMPGDFTGGSVRVTTRELPEKLTVTGTLLIGFNTETTFGERLTYRGSSTDFLGIDDGTRALPGSIPDYKVVRLGNKPDGTKITKEELTAYGRAMNAYMSTQKVRTLPNVGGNVTLGHTLKFGADHELGFVGALTYGRKFQSRNDEVYGTFQTNEASEDRKLGVLNDYRAQTGLDLVSWGGYLGLTYRYAKDHKISLIGLHSRSSENEARQIFGYNDEAGANIADTRLRFASRSLTFGQLVGEHKLRKVNDATLDWSLTASMATSDEPDTRETVYQESAPGRLVWDDGTLSGLHFFANQSERVAGGLVNWTQPIVKGDAPTRLKAGLLVLSRARTFDARRFRFIAKNPPGFDYARGPDELFVPEYIGTALELEEFTRPNDSYVASSDVIAGYVMTDTSPLPWLRLVLGARVESSAQVLDSFDPFAAELTKERAELRTVDLLPSASVIFKTSSRSNLRFSASRTVARPELRELAPFLFTEYFGSRDVYGNPNLDRTSVANFDMRFEFFPTLGEVAAISVFYKDFSRPIEKVILPAGSRGTDSFQNALGATNAGIEVELRKNLGFVRALSDFGTIANVTLVHSRVKLDETQTGIQTNATRPLAGQSPFVVNAGLDYANDKSGTRVRLLYNVFGRRIAQVGANGLPDVYEQPRHLLDATVAQRVGKHVDLKLAAENLLLAPVRFTQGPTVQSVSHPVLGELTNLVSQVQPGATFTFSVTVQN
jgi:hypothetical protein